MSEENMSELLNFISTEGAPVAQQTIREFGDHLNSVNQTTKALNLSVNARLDEYKLVIEEQISTARVSVQDADRKLQVLFSRLEDTLQVREADVDGAIASRQEFTQTFLKQSEAIDSELGKFETDLLEFQSQAEELKNDITDGVSSYQASAEELHGQVLSTVDAYNTATSESVNLLVEALDDGTSSTVDKIDTLTNSINEKITQYHSEYGEMFSILTEQSGSELEAYNQVLNISGEAVAGVSEVFDGAIGDIADKLETIGDLIGEIKPILDFIDELA